VHSLEGFLGYPVFQLGVLVDRLKKRDNPSRLFFFFPHYHTGGAEQVHVDILRIFAGVKPWVIITGKSNNSQHLKAMQLFGQVIEIGRYFTDLNRFFVKNYFLGYYTSLLNRHHKPVLLSSLCGFPYELAPFLKNCYTIDIIHGLNGLRTRFILQAVNYLDRRIIVSENVRQSLHTIYVEHGITKKLGERLQVIHNAVFIDDSFPEKEHNTPYRVVFVGRNSAEKRYHLYSRIAELSSSEALPYEFISIGDLPAQAQIHNMGEILARDKLYEVLKSCHILIMCSYSEGLPLVVAEAMACGVVPLATDVGGVSEIILKGETGQLVSSTTEQQIICDFLAWLQHYSTHAEQLVQQSKAAYEHAKEHFNYSKFNLAYREMIENALSREIKP